jgi:lipopolysaccharide transport system ATP-binding protein
MVITSKQEFSAQSQPEDDVILSVNGVSKRFCRDLKRSLMYGMQDIASELVGLRGNQVETLRSKEFWALKDVSFQVRRGEAIGLVGKNGSGKSTLLRVIAGLIKPDTGSVEVKGRVAPLIALGAGFNPILTGRENIYANMSILGVSKAEIDQRFDEVLEFAEIGEAIDSPVQSYSSGMAARLGFATAIFTKPDILLIDEVLAVGDSRFRAKCYRKLHDLRQQNTAFILVSHDTHTILTVCESAVYLNKGKQLGAGETPLIMRQYEEDLFSEEANQISNQASPFVKPQLEGSTFEINSIFFRDSSGEIIESPMSGEPTNLCIVCTTENEIENVGVTVSIKGLAEGGETVLQMNCLHDKHPLKFAPGKNEIRLLMPSLGLRAGTYVMDIYSKKDGFYHLDSIENFRFKVQVDASLSRGIYYQPRTWNVVTI